MPPTTDRIAALDVLRGVAVGGILFANAGAFFGLFLLSPEQLAALPTAAADRVAQFLERVFVEGKFYSIFSLLFGIGFGIQLSRGGATAVPRFRRRLRWLLAIGAFHALFIWAGDILMLYALLGFLMPWLARRSDNALLRWTVGLLAVPPAMYLIGLGFWTLLADSGVPVGPQALPPEILVRFERMGSGGLADAFIGNLLLLAGRWIDLVATMRLPKVLGMFVLGLWTVRVGLALDPASHVDTLKRWRRFGWAVGLPANVLAFAVLVRWPYLPPSAGALLGVALQAVGIPLLALGYAATVALVAVHRPHLAGVFAPVGRMALTSYLTHSVVCVTLAYGFGAALWWRLGATQAMAIALGIVLVQIPVSRWWLGRFRYGPVEWAWRRLTYGMPLPFRAGRQGGSAW